MKKIKSDFTGKNVFVEYGPYGEYREFPFYDMKGEDVGTIDDTISDYTEKGSYSSKDNEYYIILENKAYTEDKIAVLEDDYMDYLSALSIGDYELIIK